jgi:exonuclease VII large subunit
MVKGAQVLNDRTQIPQELLAVQGITDSEDISKVVSAIEARGRVETLFFARGPSLNAGPKLLSFSMEG